MKQLTEDYVSFETAKLLKEKGFDVPVRFEYHCIFNLNQKPQFHKKLHNFNGVEYSGLTSKWYSAPTHQTALKWLREVHNIYIDILTYTTEKNIQFRWVGYEKGRLFSQEEGKTIYFDSYEQAVEASLLCVLKNLI